MNCVRFSELLSGKLFMPMQQYEPAAWLTHAQSCSICKAELCRYLCSDVDEEQDRVLSLYSQGSGREVNLADVKAELQHA